MPKIAECIENLMFSDTFNYLVFRKEYGQNWFEICNTGALCARLAHYFGGTSMGEIEVLKISKNSSPHFTLQDGAQLKKVYTQYKSQRDRHNALSIDDK